MTIVEAVKALTEGKKIRRNDWEKGHYIILEDNQVVSEKGWVSGLCIDDFSANWWEEYKEPVLDEKEKEYLSAVIRPFRDRVKYIYKINVIDDCSQIISIRMKRYDFEENLRCEYYTLISDIERTTKNLASIIGIHTDINYEKD